MLMAKPQATAGKPPLVLPSSGYRHHEQPNSTKCLKTGQLPMQTASRVAEHPWFPLDKRAPCLSARCWLFTQECCWPPSSQWKRQLQGTFQPDHPYTTAARSIGEHSACCPLKASLWPAWLLGVSIQRLDSVLILPGLACMALGKALHLSI